MSMENYGFAASIKAKIEEAKKLLDEHRDDWEPRYKGYCDILGNRSDAQIITADPTVRPPLFEYTTVTLNDNLVNLCYKGQIVGKLELVDGDEQWLCIDDRISDHNSHDFRLDIPEGRYEWKQSPEAQRLRDHFAEEPKKYNKQGATVESALISFIESKNKNSEEKGIQPVKLAGKRFHMPTPVRASDTSRLRYGAGPKQGEIDILARSNYGFDSRLTAIEVKSPDEKTKFRDALLQAVSYGVFLRELIRSENAGGSRWLKYFSINREIKDSEMIRCMVAMVDISEEDQELIRTIGMVESPMIGNDKIELGFLSLDPETFRVTSSSLEWKGKGSDQE